MYLVEVKNYVTGSELSNVARETLEQAFRSIISRSSVPDNRFNNCSFSQVAEDMINLIRSGQVDAHDVVIKDTFSEIKQFLDSMKRESNPFGNTSSNSIALTPLSKKVMIIHI